MDVQLKSNIKWSVQNIFLISKLGPMLAFLYLVRRVSQSNNQANEPYYLKASAGHIWSAGYMLSMPGLGYGIA